MNKTIVVTDIHLQDEGENAFGMDTRAKFEKVLLSLQKEAYDFLVIAGDLCFQSGNTATYRYCKKQLDDLRKPYAVIPGNHDDSAMMADVFGLNLVEGEIYYSRLYAGAHHLFLDSSKGYMEDGQWSWVERELRTSGESSRVFIFMHHPPVLGFVPHMDKKYSFQQLQKWEALMDDFGHLDVSVFTGHYHQSFCIQKKNYTVYLTPSTAMQIDDKREDFGIDHDFPAYRRLWYDEEQLYTAVRYLFQT